MHPIRKLETTLLSLYKPEQVSRLLMGHRLGPLLTSALPSPTVPPADFFHEVAVLLDRNRAIDAEMLSLLRQANPNRGGEILAALDPWLQEVPADDVFGGRYLLGKSRIHSLTGFYCDAFDQERDAHVQIKVMAPGLDPDSDDVKLLRQCLEIQERFHHPHIHRILDLRVRTSPRYIVYEAAQCWMNARLKEGGPFPRAEALMGIRGVLEALDYLHHQGIVHRNLKPSNLAIRGPGDWMVSDFKMASWSGRGDLAAAVLRDRCWAWLAPELRRCPSAADPRTDVYGVGVLLYQVLTGQLPVDLHGEDHLEGLDPDLAEVILKATRLRLDHRYGSAAEMLAALPPR